MANKAPEPSRSHASQMAFEARDDVPSLPLLFVDVGKSLSRAQLSARQAEDGAEVRSHVMKEYLLQKGRPKMPSTPSPKVLNLSEHLSTFRLTPRDTGKRQRRKRKETTPVPLRIRAIASKDTIGLQEVILSRPLTKNPFPTITSPVDISQFETATLLEYYHASFWDNSVACNPEGHWISVAISDPGVLHATLCLVALHKLQTRQGQACEAYLWHRGEAMRLVANSLNDPERAIADATIATVAILTATDDSTRVPLDTEKSHMEGMLELVRLRGGIQGMKTNRHIQRVVIWSDILHASAHNLHPRFERAFLPVDRDGERLAELSEVRSQAGVVGDMLVPAYFRSILGNLNNLAHAKRLLGNVTNLDARQLRLHFSNVLFHTEYRILGLLNAESPFPDNQVTFPGVEAVKAATLIYTFYKLRDIAITAAFFDNLIQRLRSGLKSLCHDNCQQRHLSSSRDEYVATSFHLWLCFNGWTACATERRQTDRQYFVEKVVQICRCTSIDSETDLSSRVADILPMDEQDLLNCNRLWADILVATAARVIGQTCAQ